MYPPEEQAVFEAAWRVLDNAMLVSECQDFIEVLKEHGFELVKKDLIGNIVEKIEIENKVTLGMIIAEQIAGNTVKEANSKGVAQGLLIAKTIVQESVR